MEQNMTCPVCGNTTAQGQAFCGSCGTKLTLISVTKQASVCPTCAAPIKDGQQFCGTCGAALNTESQQQWSPAPQSTMREQSSIQIQQQPQAQTSASQPITVPLPEAAAVPPSFTKSHEAEIPKSPIVRKNHGMLPAVVSMLWVIGWIAIIGGLILTIVVAFSDAGADMLSSLSTIGLPAETGIVIKLIIGLLLSLGYGFAFMGIAGICKMLINIENNTSRHDIEK